jgi:starch phosphorylase
MNGAPNLSVLDGWWREGYDGRNGWAIGEERSYDDQDAQDEEDALSLYNTLEEEIVPLFYGSDEQRAAWWTIVKESIATITPQYNMQRMVKEYTLQLYIPAGESGEAYRADSFGTAHSVTQWKQKIRDHWHGVQVYADPLATMQTAVGEPLTASASVRLNGLSPDDVAVELVLSDESGNDLQALSVTPMQLQHQSDDDIYRYEAAFVAERSGRHAYGIRVRPNHPALIHPMELGKTRWA